MLDYAKMKKLESCMETIKECVGYKTDEQVERVTSESAKMLIVKNHAPPASGVL